jgi:hypothetical protein
MIWKISSLKILIVNLHPEIRKKPRYRIQIHFVPPSEIDLHVQYRIDYSYWFVFLFQGQRLLIQVVPESKAWKVRYPLSKPE